MLVLEHVRKNQSIVGDYWISACDLNLSMEFSEECNIFTIDDLLDLEVPITVGTH